LKITTLTLHQGKTNPFNLTIIPDRSGNQIKRIFSVSSSQEEDPPCDILLPQQRPLKNLEQRFNFQSVIRPDFSTKKPPFRRLTDKRKSAISAAFLNCFL
jgi:hypothetical protein